MSFLADFWGILGIFGGWLRDCLGMFGGLFGDLVILGNLGDFWGNLKK